VAMPDVKAWRLILAFGLAIAARGNTMGQSMLETANDSVGGATVTLDAFSGLPNPPWNLDRVQTEELLRRVGSLDPSSEPQQTGPGLGYRGVEVEVREPPGGVLSLYAARETVSRRGQNGVDILRDPKRALELWIVQSGTGYLDASLLDRITKEIRGSR
jgi:hypothetical protein